ncbi:MAG: glutaredoxin family protein [Spirochaetota bacterium]
MLEELEYTRVEGKKKIPAITVYALSTCGFCKRSIAFLEREGFSFRYIHLDHVPLAKKTEVKAELKAKFGKDVAFPFAVIDDKEVLVGFIEPDWKLSLGLGA